MNSPIAIIVIVLLILAFAGSPIAGNWHSYGWGPSGGIGGLVLVLLILWALGVI